MNHRKPSTLPWHLSWDSSLSVGIDTIDREHQVFIDMVNAFNAALRKRAELAILRRHLDAIIADAKAHFSHEEQLFAEYGYEELELHREEHARLLQEIGRLRGEFDSSLSEVAKIQIGMDLRDLLVDHLLNFDKRYCGRLS